MGLLEILPADLGGRDVRGDRQHRHVAAVRVEQPADQVQVARPAACAHRQLPGQRRLGRCREPRGLLMPDMQDPLLALQDICLIGNAHLLLPDSDIGDPAPFSRSRSIGLAIFPTGFLGSVSSMYTSRGTL